MVYRISCKYMKMHLTGSVSLKLQYLTKVCLFTDDRKSLFLFSFEKHWPSVILLLRCDTEICQFLGLSQVAYSVTIPVISYWLSISRQRLKPVTLHIWCSSNFYPLSYLNLRMRTSKRKLYSCHAAWLNAIWCSNYYFYPDILEHINGLVQI